MTGGGEYELGYAQAFFFASLTFDDLLYICELRRELGCSPLLFLDALVLSFLDALVLHLSRKTKVFPLARSVAASSLVALPRVRLRLHARFIVISLV